MAWWIWLIIAIVGVILKEIAKRTQFGWIVRLAETATYITEQKAKIENLHGEEKLKYAVKMVRELSKEWKINWIVKWIPDSVIIGLIENFVGKINSGSQKIIK